MGYKTRYQYTLLLYLMWHDNECMYILVVADLVDTIGNEQTQQ